MIECKIGKDCGVNIKMEGKVQDFACDVLCLVNAIYGRLSEQSKVGADAFKAMISLGVVGDELWNIKPEGTTISICIPKKGEPEVE